ncbi:MAG: hypothetical protein M1454_00735 [Candidatus Thermoplasmatota archaeon]|nr:hypothetical protein [Candidatus Thermoplasmatota archaeon]MCL5730998.1 hypothetical protein [Candidatus Thermoplasmatota archaeon]
MQGSSIDNAPPQWKTILIRGLPMLFIPVILLVIILLMNSFYFLEYFHVIVGSTWTGMDLVMGVFFSYIMAGLNPMQRTVVATRLTPTMLFFMPAIATSTITAGIYLAIADHISFYNPYFIAVAVIVLILLVQGLGIFLPNEARVYMEIIHGAKNVEKIVRLTMLNLKLSVVQLILQIILIFFMATFAVGGVA